MSWPPEIGPNGAWLSWLPEHHRHDDGLIVALAGLFIGSSVVDLGCGDGAYVDGLLALGVDCEGFDASPIRPVDCGYIDLSRPITCPARYDWVLCLEVGEHIPPAFQQNVFDNLDKLARWGVVLSWATEGQSGHGHVNERSNGWVERIMNSYGFERDSLTEQTLRDSVSDLYWLKSTLMVYTRK